MRRCRYTVGSDVIAGVDVTVGSILPLAVAMPLTVELLAVIAGGDRSVDGDVGPLVTSLDRWRWR